MRERSIDRADEALENLSMGSDTMPTSAFVGLAQEILGAVEQLREGATVEDFSSHVCELIRREAKKWTAR